MTSSGIRFIRKDLSSLNTMQLPCVAHRYIEISDDEDLRRVFEATRESYLVIGGASNLILPPQLNLPVIKLRYHSIELVSINNNRARIKIGASVNWDELVAWCVEQGYSGLENLSLIPGTVGAAPVQNIGAYGVELSDTLESVRVFDTYANEFKLLSNAQCRFAYRDSIFKQESGRYVIVEVSLSLRTEAQFHLDYGELVHLKNQPDLSPRKIRNTVIEIRSAKLPDPANIPNTGSFFKNPVVTTAHYAAIQNEYPEVVAFDLKDGQFKLAAGWMIDHIGMKGFQLGAAKVHERQALVLTNTGEASQADILNLAALIQQKIHDAFNVNLEIEPIVLPDNTESNGELSSGSEQRD